MEYLKKKNLTITNDHLNSKIKNLELNITSLETDITNIVIGDNDLNGYKVVAGILYVADDGAGNMEWRV